MATVEEFYAAFAALPNMIAEETERMRELMPDLEPLIVRDPIQTLDGSVISIQAGPYHGSVPKANLDDVTGYSHFEVWFPGDDEPRGGVGLEEIVDFINQHGGLIDGE